MLVCIRQHPTMYQWSAHAYSTLGLPKLREPKYDAVVKCHLNIRSGQFVSPQNPASQSYLPVIEDKFEFCKVFLTTERLNLELANIQHQLDLNFFSQKRIFKMKHTLIENPWKFSILVIFAVLIIRLLTNRYKRGICDIPGPLLAKYTRLWKLHSVWKGDHHHTAIDLHKKHGSLVRIGPNHISVGDPNAIPVIYGLNKGFTKVRLLCMPNS